MLEQRVGASQWYCEQKQYCPYPYLLSEFEDHWTWQQFCVSADELPVRHYIIYITLDVDVYVRKIKDGRLLIRNVRAPSMKSIT